MAETLATSLGRLAIVHILRAQAENELKFRNKMKKADEVSGESSKTEPGTLLVQSVVLDILEEVTATFVLEVGKCAQHYSLSSQYSHGSVLDVLDALRDFSALFYVTPRDLVLYMSLEEIFLPHVPTNLLKSSRKSLLFTPNSTRRDSSEENVSERSHLGCYESWMPPIPPPSTLILNEGKVDMEVRTRGKGTGQLYAGMRYGLLAQAKGASLQENPFLRLPHKAKEPTEY